MLPFGYHCAEIVEFLLFLSQLGVSEHEFLLFGLVCREGETTSVLEVGLGGEVMGYCEAVLYISGAIRTHGGVFLLGAYPPSRKREPFKRLLRVCAAHSMLQ